MGVLHVALRPTVNVNYMQTLMSPPLCSLCSLVLLKAVHSKYFRFIF